MLMTTPVKYPEWHRLSIGGEWKIGASEHHASVTNKFSNEVMADIPLASKQDIAAAYQAASKAQQEWAKVSPFEKAAMLEKVASLLAERQAEVVKILVEESGSSQLKENVEVG